MLVVEDEIMVAMYIEDLLVDLGFEVAGMATSLDQALRLAQESDFDFAVLDINLDGGLSFPVADVLRQRDIPFIFASGYGVAGVREDYRDAVRIQKPFRAQDLEQAIARATK
ncbi:response regulator [Microvirga makkahensis]|uniref:response regulator n=1 Tax=Microvirga makkahensis TaxID=1128670 RepID=UPI0031B643F6